MFLCCPREEFHTFFLDWNARRTKYNERGGVSEVIVDPHHILDSGYCTLACRIMSKMDSDGKNRVGRRKENLTITSE